jgi:hypothetical protein
VKGCGVAVARPQGHSWAPPRRSVAGERGNHPTAPVPVLAGRAGRGGEARRRPRAMGWGGGPVVVRARESRVHGEGVQRVHAREGLQWLEALVNTDEPWPDLDGAAQRVQRMQTKLHHWAAEDPSRRFADLFNLICHPDFLTVAWDRVRGNKGARTAGVDRVVPAFISGEATIEAFLASAREQLKARPFTPLPVRERLIPKPGKRGQFRRLGIPAAMDRLVQASLVLVWEPIFEADFSRSATAFAQGVGARTPSPRSTTSAPRVTTGCSGRTSRRASTRSTTPPSWAGGAVGSSTSASWP